MRAWMLWVVWGCNTGKDVGIERDQLKVQVADSESKNQRLEREAQGLNAKVRRMDRDLAELRQANALAGIGIAAGATLSAKVTTTKGTILGELWPDKAPLTVLNFVQLAEGTRTSADSATEQTMKRPLYNGTTFHRVIPSS